jgi:hypothetical protein
VSASTTSRKGITRDSRKFATEPIFERLSDCIGQPLDQSLKRPPASAHARGEPDSFEHRRGRDEYVLAPQVREHCLHDGLAAVSCPGSVGTDLQASAPVPEAETAQTKCLLQFDGMFPSCLVAQRIIRKGARRNAQLARDEGDHRLRRMFVKAQTLARMPKQAELDRESEPVAAAPFGADERQILGAEHVMFRHFAGLGRDAEQSRALFGGKQGSAGHWISGLVRSARS